MPCTPVLGMASKEVDREKRNNQQIIDCLLSPIAMFIRLADIDVPKWQRDVRVYTPSPAKAKHMDKRTYGTYGWTIQYIDIENSPEQRLWVIGHPLSVDSGARAHVVTWNMIWTLEGIC
ncbi:hypothetical protein CBL_13579 [Carabus blaptoides fortunei]